MSIKAKLNTERTHDDGNFVQVYDVGSYLVIVQSWRKNSKCIFVDIRSDSDSRRYLPHLSAHDNMEGGFRDAMAPCPQWRSNSSCGICRRALTLRSISVSTSSAR